MILSEFPVHSPEAMHGEKGNPRVYMSQESVDLDASLRGSSTTRVTPRRWSITRGSPPAEDLAADTAPGRGSNLRRPKSPAPLALLPPPPPAEGQLVVVAEDDAGPRTSKRMPKPNLRVSIRLPGEDVAALNLALQPVSPTEPLSPVGAILSPSGVRASSVWGQVKDEVEGSQGGRRRATEGQGQGQAEGGGKALEQAPVPAWEPAGGQEGGGAPGSGLGSADPQEACSGLRATAGAVQGLLSALGFLPVEAAPKATSPPKDASGPGDAKAQPKALQGGGGRSGGDVGVGVESPAEAGVEKGSSPSGAKRPFAQLSTIVKTKSKLDRMYRRIQEEERREEGKEADFRATTTYAGTDSTHEEELLEKTRIFLSYKVRMVTLCILHHWTYHGRGAFVEAARC
jgi:hypothetical protein